MVNLAAVTLARARSARVARGWAWRPARRAWAVCLLVAAAPVALELLARRGVPVEMPGAVLLGAVVAAAYLGGVRGGLLGAVAGLVYAAWPTAAGGVVAVEPGSALPRLLSLALLLPAVAVAVGALRERAERRLAELERAVARLGEANARLERLSMVDGLTGVANRRRFDEALAAAWALGAHQRSPLAVLLVDVDHFKAYNDEVGHPAGDTALRAVAGVLRRTLYRPTDLVARYGGEEFAVLLPDTDRAGGLVAAERLRRAVLSPGLDDPTVPARPRLTVSVGVAAAVPAEAGDPAALVAAADAALYAAKRAGRNRAHATSPVPLP